MLRLEAAGSRGSPPSLSVAYLVRRIINQSVNMIVCFYAGRRVGWKEKRKERRKRRSMVGS